MKTRGHVIATSVGVLILAIFGSCTFLYNVPEGPLRERASALVSVMDPWLSQNWSFFAPAPPSSDTGILVRFSQFNALDESVPFVDITTEGLHSTKNTLIPPREYRVLTSALDMFLSAEDSLVSLHPDGGKAEERLADRDRFVQEMLDSSSTPAEAKHQYLRARQILVRAARYFYEASEARSQTAGDAIQLRLVSYLYPRFDDRSRSATAEFDYRTLPWWSTV